MYKSLDTIQLTTLRRMIWVVQLDHGGERSCPYTVLVGKPEIKRLLGITRCKSKDKIKMDFQHMGMET
jgi:hypothetical protein